MYLIYFYIINSDNLIGDNVVKRVGESFANLPATLHTFHLNLR
jgi:hypothetical protein